MRHFAAVRKLAAVFLCLNLGLEEKKRARNKERVNKAQERALESLDYIMD